MTIPKAQLIYHADTHVLACSGMWDVQHITHLQAASSALNLPPSGTLILNGEGITQLDTAGAWFINTLINQLSTKNITLEETGFQHQHNELLTLVRNKLLQEKEGVPSPKTLPWVSRVGQLVISKLHHANDYLDFVGRLTFEALRLIPHPGKWRLVSLCSVIYKNGYQALPIIALLSFMIGVVMTYQMGLQLRNYGANIYIVDLLGLSILREFGPLLTAIMVAGRTGSAFTAELGSMTINQEIDALDTMGVTPGELLLLPRIMGLFIALPLLTVWADIFGIWGGMVMANNMLGISWYDFLLRFPHVIPLRSFMIGIGKAPVFALIIASIGCFQGMKVQGSSTSLGQNTTRSVVLGIFFIIVADALFSIIFSKLKL